MNQCVPIRHLFETHLTVSDLRRSIDFYRDVIGLQLAFEAPQRNVAFFWIGESGCSMLGLWSIGTAPLGLTLHLAFDVLLDDLLGAHKILKASGITTFSILGEETIEPSVICWMPAAAIYFRDPDGHLLEYLTLLNEAPRPDLGITSWSDWLNIKDRAVRSEISQQKSVPPEEKISFLAALVPIYLTLSFQSHDLLQQYVISVAAVFSILCLALWRFGSNKITHLLHTG